MTATNQAFDDLVEQKIEKMMPYLVKLSGNDPDLIQDGCIGIWQAMRKEPDASDSYHRTKAKWNIGLKLSAISSKPSAEKGMVS